MSWRLVDHTADVAIEADAPTEGAALAEAGTALTSVITGHDDPRRFQADVEMHITVEAPDREALLVAWLSELLWLAESEGHVWVTGGIEIATSHDGGFRLTAQGNGIAYDPAKHGRGVEVKAITYHDVSFAPDAGHRWHLRVVLDL